jgi:hypothetical protein
MPTLETIRRLTVEGQSRGMEKVVSDLNKVAGAQQQLAKASEVTSTTTETNEKRVLSAASAYERLQNRIDPVHRELRQVERDFKALNDAASQNIGLERYSENIQKIVGRTREAQRVEHERAAEMGRIDKAMDEYAAKAQRRAADRLAYEQKISQTIHDQAAAVAAQNVDKFLGISTDPRGSQARASAEAISSALTEQETVERALAQYEEMRIRRAREHMEYEARTTSALKEQQQIQTAASSQQSIRTLTGQDRNATGTGFGQGATFSALTEEFERQDRLAKAANNLRSQINPVAHAMTVMNKELAEYSELAQAGAISTHELAQAQDMARAKFDIVSRGLGKDGLAGNLRLTSNQLTNLGYQFNDIASGLAMGQSPFTIMAQQGGQVYQVLAGARGGLTEGIKSAGSWLWGLVTPARAAGAALIGAATEAFAAWNRFDNQQIEIRRSLLGVGRNIGFSPDQFNQMAERISSLGAISTRTALEITTAMSKIGRFSGENLEAMGKIAKDFAATIGKDVPDAVQELAQSMSSFSGIERLNQQLRFLDGVTLNNIRSLFNLGKSYDAVNLAVSKLQQNALVPHTEVQGRVKTLTEQLTIAFSNLDRKVGEYLDKLTKIAAVNATITSPRNTQQVTGGLFSGIGAAFKPGPPVPLSADMGETNIPLPPRRPESLMAPADAQDRFEEALASARKAKQVQEELNFVTTRASEISREFGSKNAEEMKRYGEIAEFVTRIQKEGTDEQRAKVVELARENNGWDRLATAVGSFRDEQGKLITDDHRARENLRIDTELRGRVSEERRIELERERAVLNQVGVVQSSTEKTIALTKDEILLRREKKTQIEDDTHAMSENIRLTGQYGETLETSQQLLQRQLAFRQQNIPLSREETRILEDRIAAQIRSGRVQEQVTAIYTAFIRPATDLNDTIKAANFLFQSGVININQYGNAIEDARIKALQAEQTLGGGLEAGLRRLGREWGDVSKQAENFVYTSGNNAVSAFLDIADGTKTAADGVKDFTKSFLRMASEMIIKITVLQPMIKSLTGAFGGGLLGGGGASSSGTAATGDLVFGTMHRGGVVGRDVTGYRYVHPAYFDDAPRLHKGTLQADERAAILQTGEIVLSRQEASQARAGGSQSQPQIMHLNVSLDGAKGNREIEEMAAQGVARGIAAYDKELTRGGLAKRMSVARSRGQTRG